MSELIKITNLRKTYDGKRYVLDGLNFSIGKGEIKTILELRDAVKAPSLI